MTSVLNTATATAERFDMFPSGAPVLAMVSGGADSVSLLRLLAAGAFGELPLRVLHVNHLLRGDESEADEAFVRHLGGSLGIEVRVVRYDVADHAESEGLNLEDAGRRIRYSFAESELDAWCRELGVSPLRGRIAVAHTLDDRIETFFMRALFGAGAGGLASIAPVRGRVVRPLLGVERPSLRAWLEDQGAVWREDPSNEDTTRLRALVRAELLPVAERINPSFRSALGRSMDLLADDDALLTSMAEAFARDFAHVDAGVEVVFNRELMATLDRTMARRTVRAALGRAFPEASRIEAEHVEKVVDGIGREGFSHDLPGGLRAFGEYDKMVIGRSDAASQVVAPSLLPVPGMAHLGVVGTLEAELVGPDDVSGNAESVVVDGDLLQGELTVDGTRPGDRIRPFGMEGTRKVSDMLVDAKVPRRTRTAVPIVRDGDRIVWVAGVRMSEDYRVTDETTKCVRLTWRRDENRLEDGAGGLDA